MVLGGERCGTGVTGSGELSSPELFCNCLSRFVAIADLRGVPTSDNDGVARSKTSVKQRVRDPSDPEHSSNSWLVYCVVFCMAGCKYRPVHR